MINKYLEDILAIDSKIANKLYEIEMWKDIAIGVSNSSDGERVQNTSNKQKMADAVIKYTDIEREIDALELKKQRFIELIEKLPKKHYTFMHDVYIKGMSITETARMNGKSDSWGSSTHLKAKKKLTAIMSEEEGKN